MRGTQDRRSLLANTTRPVRESPLLSCALRQRPPRGDAPFFQESWKEPFCTFPTTPHRNRSTPAHTQGHLS